MNSVTIRPERPKIGRPLKAFQSSGQSRYCFGLVASVAGLDPVAVAGAVCVLPL
jgi:hypothetical protein